MGEAKIVTPQHNQKSLELQQHMLEDMEATMARQRKVQPQLQEIEDKVIKSIKEAIEDERMTPYKAAMAYGRLVDTHIRYENLKMSMYDRLSGATMLGISTQEQEAKDVQNDEAFDLEKDRAAEQLCLDLIAYKAEMDRKLREAEALVADEEARLEKEEQRKQA